MKPEIKYNPNKKSFTIKLLNENAYRERRLTLHIKIGLTQNGELVYLETTELGAKIPYVQLQEEHGVNVETQTKIQKILNLQKNQ